MRDWGWCKFFFSARPLPRAASVSVYLVRPFKISYGFHFNTPPHGLPVLKSSSCVGEETKVLLKEVRVAGCLVALGGNLYFTSECI